MNLESVKEESREIFIEFTNGMCEAMALGKKTLMSIVNDSMRIQWMGGMTSKTADVAEAEVVNYGCLYNHHAVTDERGICASNAHSMTMTEWRSLVTDLGGIGVAGGKLKEAEFLHWDSPNEGATNEVGFNSRGAGSRSAIDGVFSGIKQHSYFWFSDSYMDEYGYEGVILYSSPSASIDTWNHAKYGRSIRLIVDTPIEINGNSAIYVGNDLRRYRCVLINGVWYLAENLSETKFRNGNLITKVTDATAWSLLETEGYCAYDNDEANALTITAEVEGGQVVDSVDNYTPTLAIEALRHYRGKYQSVDLSQIGVVTNPSAPAETLQDLLRSGSQAATIGANIIVFSSPLSTDAYTVNVWIIGDGESQYDLGDITKATTGFTVSDALIEGTLYYQVIVVI